MKKNKLLVCLVLSIVFGNTLFAQYVYYDAKDLRALIDTSGKWKQSNKTVVADILAHYTKKSDVGSDFFNNNPFIKDLASGISDRSGLSGSMNKISVSGIAGLDVTKYANAIADIMIERTKQELTVAFFNRFKNFAKDNPEFQILFPKTTNNLSNLLTYAYPQMLPALRKGFFDDLKQITYHLDDVLELPRYRHLLNNFPEVKIAVRSIRLVHNLEDGTSTAADVIKSFADLNEWNDEGSSDFKNMKATVKFASIFSESLRSKDTDKIWIPAKEVKKSISDEIFVKIFMGLIYQQIKNKSIEFFIDKSQPLVSRKLTDILEEQKDNIILFQNKLSEFSDLSDKVINTYNILKPQIRAGSKIPNEDIYNYINLSIDITDYAFSVVKIFNEDLINDKYLTIVRNSNELYRDIYSEAYTKAVNDAVDIIKQVHDLTKANPHPTLLDKKPALNTLLTFIDKVKPYALFMANMVEAKDEPAIKAALENVILPVGSSSVKKFTRGNISVQTYLGAFLSTSTKQNSLEGAWSDKFGVTAPIGISWTPGFLSWEKAGSLSLFTALFDLGAIVDYKLKKESDATGTDPNATVISKEYKIELGQIFSPGVYAVYGWGGNIPLSLGFGAQYGPGLSKIDAGSKTVLTNPSWRWNFFLAVDLPFFNLVNKPKKQ